MITHGSGYFNSSSHYDPGPVSRPPFNDEKCPSKSLKIQDIFQHSRQKKHAEVRDLTTDDDPSFKKVLGLFCIQPHVVAIRHELEVTISFGF